MNFIRNFKKTVNDSLQLIVLGLIFLYVLLRNLSFTGPIVFSVINTISLLLVLSSLVFLLLEKKLFASHILLLVLFFANAFQAFNVSIFSLRFSPFGFATPLTLSVFINFIIFIYLALMIASYLLSGGLKAQKLGGNVFLLVLVFLIFLYAFNGFTSLMIYMVILGVILLFGTRLSTLLIITSSALSSTYVYINNVINGFTVFQFFGAIASLLILSYAIYLIYLIYNRKKV